MDKTTDKEDGVNNKTVIAIMGLPLTGKTTFGRALSQLIGIHYIDIDDGPVRCAPPQEENPYRDDAARMRERKRMIIAYTVKNAAITANLEAELSLIVLATYSRKSAQEFLVQAVQEGGGELKIVWCYFNDTPEEISRRVNDRLARNERGGCRSVQHYLDDKARYEGTELPHLKIDPSQMTDEDWNRVFEHIGYACAKA